MGNATQIMPANIVAIEPRHEKICLRGFQPGKTQTCLRSYRSCAGKVFYYPGKDIETRDIILSRQRKTKVLIRLHGCTG